MRVRVGRFKSRCTLVDFSRILVQVGKPDRARSAVSTRTVCLHEYTCASVPSRSRRVRDASNPRMMSPLTCTAARARVTQRRAFRSDSSDALLSSSHVTTHAGDSRYDTPNVVVCERGLLRDTACGQRRRLDDQRRRHVGTGYVHLFHARRRCDGDYQWCSGCERAEHHRHSAWRLRRRRRRIPGTNWPVLGGRLQFPVVRAGRGTRRLWGW